MTWSSTHKYSTVLYLCATICVVCKVVASSNDDYYVQKWPNEEDYGGQGTTPLYFGLATSLDPAIYDGSGALPAVQLALKQINSDPSMLPGYTLHYTLTDSKCDHTKSLSAFFKQINAKPIKIAWIGSGCSVATEPVAETSHYFNITHISCDSSSSELADRDRFRYYFQMLVAEHVLAYGFFGIVQEFGWKKVVILEQDENLFTVASKILKNLLDDAEIDYEVRRFESEDGIAGLGPKPFDGGRIFIFEMYRPYVQDLLCKAYHQGVRYPRYLFLTRWHDLPLWDGHDQCTREQIEQVLYNTLAVRQRFNFITNYSTVADSGISGHDYEELYADQVEEAKALWPTTTPTLYGQPCYDATWTLAYALNKTISDLNTDNLLNIMAANASELSYGERFTMANFTYSNYVIAETMFEHLKNTDFLGIIGNINFNSDGLREGNSLIIFHYARSSDGNLTLIEAGQVLEGVNVSLMCPSGDCDKIIWEDGPVPYDGTPVEETVTVHVSLTVIYSLLATAGIIFAVLCLVFNFVCRESLCKLDQLSSPNLNYIIGIGAIMLYVVVYLSVIPTTSEEVNSVVCAVSPWLTSLGYSLCFGSILAKMTRVYYIITNKTQERRDLQEWQLALMIFALVVVDLVILTVYTVVEGVTGHLGATKVENKENPMDTKGELDVVYEYYFYTCKSTSRDITLGLLYGYKGVVQVISLLFAFQIRNAQVKGLSDAMFIAGANYVTSIILAVTIVSIYSLAGLVNVYPAVFGLGLLVGSTATLALVFVPKMVRKKLARRQTVTMHTDGTNEFVGSLRRKVTNSQENSPQPARQASFLARNSASHLGNIQENTAVM